MGVGAENLADVPRAVRAAGASEELKLIKAIAAARQNIILAKLKKDAAEERRA